MINANLGQFLNTGWFSEATLFYKGYIYWCDKNLREYFKEKFKEN